MNNLAFPEVYNTDRAEPCGRTSDMEEGAIARDACSIRCNPFRERYLETCSLLRLARPMIAQPSPYLVL